MRRRAARPDHTSHVPPVVLITGASSGIGRATAERYASGGASLVLCSRSHEALDTVADRARTLGAGRVLVLPTDVSDRAQVHAAFDTAVAELGRIDVCVSSAAVMSYGLFLDTPPEVYEQVVSTNLLGSANVARAALQLFRAQEVGTLVVVGSLLGRVATPWISSYVSAKWGLRGLTRVLAQEMRDMPGVHVTSVAPGAVDTPIYRQAATYLGRTGSPPPPAAAPDVLARAVLAAVARPTRERDSDAMGGLGNKVISFGFTAVPGVYDVLVAPLMGRLGLSGDRTASGAGNVFAPHPELER